MYSDVSIIRPRFLKVDDTRINKVLLERLELRCDIIENAMRRMEAILLLDTGSCTDMPFSVNGLRR